MCEKVYQLAGICTNTILYVVVYVVTSTLLVVGQTNYIAIIICICMYVAIYTNPHAYAWSLAQVHVAQPFVQLLLKLIINYVQLLEYKNV